MQWIPLWKITLSQDNIFWNCPFILWCTGSCDLEQSPLPYPPLRPTLKHIPHSNHSWKPIYSCKLSSNHKLFKSAVPVYPFLPVSHISQCVKLLSCFGYFFFLSLFFIISNIVVIIITFFYFFSLILFREQKKLLVILRYSFIFVYSKWCRGVKTSLAFNTLSYPPRPTRFYGLSGKKGAYQ